MLINQVFSFAMIEYLVPLINYLSQISTVSVRIVLKEMAEYLWYN